MSLNKILVGRKMKLPDDLMTQILYLAGRKIARLVPQN